MPLQEQFFIELFTSVESDTGLDTFPSYALYNLRVCWVFLVDGILKESRR